ncbi:MAG TPA: XdhC family protein [Solirubrobacteraceae bacterium]|nr:XdhC family protein [Solirubrobacteraceae bacterium]
MIARRLAERAEGLAAAREPFVQAVVVRAQRPTSVRPGDTAFVLADGTIEGFVGGACAEESVRLHALRALETGEPLLLRIVPGDPDDDAGIEGTVTVANPCLSGGALEIFLEPRLPAPRVLVVGETPVALALAELAGGVGFDPELTASGAQPSGEDAAVVVASHGRGEEAALIAALRAGVPYVGLVASRARGRAVVEALDVEPALAERVHTPAGLDIGARSPAEIALAILAEVIALRHRLPSRAPAEAAEGVDPVCGMTVAITPATPRAGDEVFCCEGCRDAYLARSGG